MKSLWVKSWKMNNNQKRYFHINSGYSTKQIFSLFIAYCAEWQRIDTEELLNDSAMKFIALKRSNLLVQVFWRQKNASVLTSEANVYVVDKGTTYSKWLNTNKKRKNLEENTWHLEIQRFSTFSRELSSWGRSFLPILRKCFSFDTYE